MLVKISFSAVGTPDTVDDVCHNFYEQYPEFAAHMDEDEYVYDKNTKEFKLLWVGEFEEDELDDHDIDVLIRLTHHAEGFYECTDAEFVHVEVYVQDRWYGKCDA